MSFDSLIGWSLIKNFPQIGGRFIANINLISCNLINQYELLINWKLRKVGIRLQRGKLELLAMLNNIGSGGGGKKNYIPDLHIFS